MGIKKSVSPSKEADVKGKRVLVTADLNLTFDDNFKIADDTRIQAVLPAVKHMILRGAKVLLYSHLERPRGVPSQYSFRCVASRLFELLGVEVRTANGCPGEEVEELVAQLQEGDVLLLDKMEKENDPEFAEKLASLADIVASVDEGGVVTLEQKDLDCLVRDVAISEKPFAASGGGSKVYADVSDLSRPNSTSSTPDLHSSYTSMVTKRSVKSLKEADLKGKRALVRADLNVPMDDSPSITDDTRIRAVVPTVEYLLDYYAKVILCSHLGRPEGVTSRLSLKHLVARLSELLGVEVKMANDCIGEEVEKLVAELPEGGVLLLENVRFHREEEKNDPEFAKKLAALADLYVNDAFATAHRAHASTAGVAKYLKPSVAGFLMQKELDYLVGAVANPKKPFAAIVGGSKVSTKITVIESLLEKVQILLVGGGMIFTFYKAQGISVGSSGVEEEQLHLATSILEKAKAKGVPLLLPTDVVAADNFAADADSKVVPASGIPDKWTVLDSGPDSIKAFREALDKTQTILWNGPMGACTFDKFEKGTVAMAEKLAELTDKGVTTIVGGGSTVAAVEKAGLASKMSHISTGGGATLELLGGKSLPGVLALDDA